MDYQKIAHRVISEEVRALNKLAEFIPSDFSKLVAYILSLKGRVILTGMGKSGHIAKKIAASLASTGTASFYIHPSEASHGDLGMITESDMVIMLSTSGETKELFDTINYCKRYNIKIASITMKQNSTLCKNCDFLLNIPEQKEASMISAPTTSAVMMLALGDALVVTLHEAKGFSKDDFLIFHPGGKIGANLLKVSGLMHVKDKIPVVTANTKFQELVLEITNKRLGCAIVVDSDNKIIGIVTDGDLRRSIHFENLTSKVASDLMTKSPITVDGQKLASEALFIMNDKSISVLPVSVDGKLAGILHIYDILRAGVV